MIGSWQELIKTPMSGSVLDWSVNLMVGLQQLRDSREFLVGEAIQDLNIFISNYIKLWKLSITVAPDFLATDISLTL